MGFEKLDNISGIKEKVVHHSFIDVYGMMKAIPAWFKAFEYDFYEKGLAEKDIGTGHQVESDWIGSRKVDEYVKFNIELSIVIKDLRKIIADDGTETYWGRTTITIKSSVDKDYQKTYKKRKRNKVLGFFVELYERYFLKDYFIKYTGKSDEECLDLLATIRKYLK